MKRYTSDGRFLECPACSGTDFHVGRFSILNDCGIRCTSCGMSIEIRIDSDEIPDEEYEITCLDELEKAWNRRPQIKNELEMSPDGYYACLFCGSTSIDHGAFNISADWIVICENCGAYMEGSIPWNGITIEEHDAACFEAGRKAWNRRTK